MTIAFLKETACYFWQDLLCVPIMSSCMQRVSVLFTFNMRPTKELNALPFGKNAAERGAPTSPPAR